MNDTLKDFINSRTKILAENLNNSTWKAYALVGDYQSLLSCLDGELTGGKASKQARLWWVRAQLELGRVPISVLSAPLEEYLEELRRDVDLYELSSITFLALGQALFKKGQGRLAVVLIERSFEFAKKVKSISQEELDSIKAFLMEAITAEIEVDNNQLSVRSKQRDAERENYKQALRKKLELLEQLDEDETNFSNNQHQPKYSGDQITSKSIIQLGEDVTLKEDKELKPGNSKALAWVVFCLGSMGAIILAGWYYYEQSTEKKIYQRLAFREEPLEVPELKLPELRLPDVQDVRLMEVAGSGLADVMKQLDKLSASNSQPQESTLDNNQGTTPNTNREQVVSTVKKDSEAVTTTPKTRDLSQTVVEDLGVTGVQTSVNALKGERVRPSVSYEVEQLHPPVMFNVIVSTYVYESPSLLARTLTRLEANSNVQGVARMGGWLKVKSTGGRYGYVFAQDVVQLK
jgi:hypothetical protein